MPDSTLHQPFEENEVTRTIELLSGQQVLDLIGDSDFLKQWDSLYRSCPWATVFQSSRFVVPWYQVHEKEYLPVVVKDVQDGRLTGLLTLAFPNFPSTHSNIHNKHLLMMGAGMYDAEYQTWLALPPQSDSFIEQSLNVIKKLFPSTDILLRFLPPGTPLGWISKNPRWKQIIELQAAKRPFIDLQAPDLSRIFRKAEFRNKLNRLKRLGDFRFEQITNLTRLQSILGELTVQYDFRQGALFNMNQFRDDPLKAVFLVEIFKRGLLHVTVLKVNNEIIACIMAVQGDGWVHLAGINIHSPFYANYSPGFVHFLLLAQQLAQAGIAYFDLTPGGDAYKERMANRHDIVHELVVCNNLLYRAKRLIRKTKHTLLIKMGIRPMAFDLLLNKRLYLIKAKLKAMLQQGGTTSILQKIKASATSDNTGIWRIAPPKGIPFEPMNVHENDLSDLLDFEQNGGGITRWEFLEDAMRRFEVEQKVYTWSENSCLVACIWLNITKSEQTNPAVPEGSALLESLYCHPKGHINVMDFILTIANSIAVSGDIPIFLVADLSDPRLQNALENAPKTAVLHIESDQVNSQKGAA